MLQRVSDKINPSHDHSGYKPEARYDGRPLKQFGPNPIPVLQLVADDDDRHRQCDTEEAEESQWLRAKENLHQMFTSVLQRNPVVSISA